MTDSANFILDTNVVSELRKGRKADENVLRWVDGVPAGSLYLSAVSVLELEMGVLRKRRSDESQGDLLRTWMDQHVLRAFHGRVLPVDTTVALQCARLHVPDPKSERDALIAATALVHQMTVVTRNTRDFGATGVDLLNPWQPPLAPAARQMVAVGALAPDGVAVFALGFQRCGHDLETAVKWYRQEAMPEFDGKTPESLVADGRAEELLAFLRR